MGKTLDKYYWSTMTIDEIKKELKDINSVYKADFNYLVEKKPYNERKGIRRIDKPKSKNEQLKNDYLIGATPENIRINVVDNPLIKIISSNGFKYILKIRSLLERIDKVEDGELEDVYIRKPSSKLEEKCS